VEEEEGRKEGKEEWEEVRGPAGAGGGAGTLTSSGLSLHSYFS
jgi:hypothetical protein